MLSKVELEYLKNENPLHQVIHITFTEIDQEFVFRTITPEEYDSIIRISRDEDQRDDLVCQVAIVHPKDYDFAIDGMAGVPTTCSKNILELSCLSNPDVIIDTYKAHERKMQNTRYSFMAMVKAAMPEVRWEDMESWGWPRLIEYTAAAKRVLEFQSIAYDKDDDIEVHIMSEEEKDMAFTEEMIQGIDPILEYGHTLKYKNDELPSPFLGGTHWRNGDVVDELRSQIYTRLRSNSSYL